MADSHAELRLEWLPGRFAVCRLGPDDPIPQWARLSGPLVSITRTERELSIMLPQQAVPADVRHEPGWVALRVVGRLDFAMVGVLSRLSGALADAGVSVFVISTYDTDVVLIREGDTARALAALKAVAHVPVGPAPERM